MTWMNILIAASTGAVVSLISVLIWWTLGGLGGMRRIFTSLDRIDERIDATDAKIVRANARQASEKASERRQTMQETQEEATRHLAAVAAATPRRTVVRR